MKDLIPLVLVFLTTMTASASRPRTTVLPGESRLDLASRVSASWADPPRLAARQMMSRYGAPDEIGASRLVWHGNGPWKRTIVRDARGDERGVLEQTASCAVSPEQGAALAAFSKSLSYDSARMELTSRADREELNLLRLNLADDILRGRVTVAEAQEAYARTVALEAAGKTTRYLRGLTFGPGFPTTP